MKIFSRILIFLFIVTDAFLLGKILLAGKNVQILNPQGPIAFQERDLIFLALGLMLLGVVPVFIYAFVVATRYHEGNKKAAYTPEWDHNNKLQIFFWAFLLLIMSTLSVICWVSAHALDPRNALAATKKPLVIQVVALRWKWLFIYPEQHIATVNYIAFPEKTPITFEITAMDTPMNSFWIPQLGGQIYAMAGMATQIHLMADGVGQYRGSSAEISGAGFANMRFTAKSVSQTDFDTWVAKAQQSPQALSFDTVTALSKPSEIYPVTYYSSTEDNLFTTIVMHYMAPNAQQNMMHDSMQNAQPTMPAMQTHMSSGS